MLPRGLRVSGQGDRLLALRRARRLRVLPVQPTEPRHRRPDLFTPRVSLRQGPGGLEEHAGDPQQAGQHLPADLVRLRGLSRLYMEEAHLYGHSKEPLRCF